MPETFKDIEERLKERQVKNLWNIPGSLEERMSFLMTIMSVVIVVLFVGFATLLTTLGVSIWFAQRSVENTYQSLREEVSETERKVDAIGVQVIELKLSK